LLNDHNRQKVPFAAEVPRQLPTFNNKVTRDKRVENARKHN
jgi:hypothetical protein